MQLIILFWKNIIRVSPYACCMNNPVRYVDPTGMDWRTKEDEEYAKMLSQAITRKINSEQRSLDKLNIKIDRNREGRRDVSKRDQEKATEMQSNIDDLKAGISELNDMGETQDQVFTYNKIERDVGGAEIKDGVIVMNIAGNGSVSNGVHESSHGFDIWKSGMPKTVPDFYATETKAYGRQFSLGGSSAMPSSDWGRVNSLRDITTPWVSGITHNGEYMYGQQIMGAKYNKALIRSLLNEYKKMTYP